jgi:hypothetical protein
MEDPRKEPKYRDEDSAEEIVEAYLIEADVTGLCALADVVAERKRQIEVEGWSHEHDDSHASGEMARAAASYAMLAAMPENSRMPALAPALFGCRILGVPSKDTEQLWPWSIEWWKPKDRRRDLVRAGALIVAEIERLDRAKNTPEVRSPQGASLEADRSRIDAARFKAT